MPQTADEIVVAAKGSVHLAPAGTTLPTTVDDDLDSGFFEVGFISDDGATLTISETKQEIVSWQSGRPVRRFVTRRDLTAAFEMQQWNPDNIVLAFGGGEWSEPEEGHFRYHPPGDEDALQEYAAVIRWQDGGRKSQIVIERSNSMEDVETKLSRDGESRLPITVEALTADDSEDDAWNYDTNDPAFAAAIGS